MEFVFFGGREEFGRETGVIGLFFICRALAKNIPHGVDDIAAKTLRILTRRHQTLRS